MTRTIDATDAVDRADNGSPKNGLSSKGLSAGSVGLVGAVVIGVSCIAPAYTLTGALGPTVAEVGTQLPAIFLAGFIPMLLVALGYRELNKAMPDSGTSFTWATRAFGPWIGWMAGWGLIAATVVVLSNLAGIAVDFFYLMLSQMFGNNPGIAALAGNPFVNVGTCLAFIAAATWIGELNRSLQHSFDCEVLSVWSKDELVEKQARFWVLMAQGSTLTAACEAVGVNRRTGRRWRQATGGRIPRPKPDLSGRYLCLEERLRIADLHVTGVGVRAIAAEVGRSAATVSRELARGGSKTGPRTRTRYAPYAAQKQAELRGRRPKASKFDHPELASLVQAKLCVKWSPEQISDHLATVFPDRQEMRVSPETIYQALYVQGRGHLRADLHQHLRTGRAVRRPRRPAAKNSGKIPDMIMISERPAEVADRAVPGHWEGDLILGSNCRSAIATLVERQTRFTMLVHLPGDHGAIAVRDGLLATIKTLPERLTKTLTWDQGTELAQHRQITMATKMAIYFCDPHSPWQRGTNENTNGLLRQYFPKGTDLSVHSPERLLEVATELNNRPRKTLGGITPAQAMQRLLSDPEKPIVATTG